MGGWARKRGVEPRNSNTRAVRGLIKGAIGRGQPALIEKPAFTFYLLYNCSSVCLNGRLLSSLSDRLSDHLTVIYFLFIWMSIFLTNWFSPCLFDRLSDYLNVCLSVWMFVCPSAVIIILILLSQDLRLQGFFFSYQKQTDFNRKRLNLYTEKPVYLHLTLNVLDDWYQTKDSMRVSLNYYPTAQSRVQITRE